MQHSPESRARSAEILAEAIHERHLVEATYNGAVMKLAPYQLFVRHDALYVRALNPQKSRGPDQEPVLGVFKLDGLSGLALTDLPFDPVPSFESQLPRPDDVLVTGIESA